jgi:hypothetical protein
MQGAASAPSSIYMYIVGLRVNVKEATKRGRWVAKERGRRVICCIYVWSASGVYNKRKSLSFAFSFSLPVVRTQL